MTFYQPFLSLPLPPFLYLALAGRYKHMPVEVPHLLLLFWTARTQGLITGFALFVAVSLSE